MQKNEVCSSPAWNITDSSLLIDNMPRDESIINQNIVETLSGNNNSNPNPIGQILLIGVEKSFFDQGATTLQNSDSKLTDSTGTEIKIERDGPEEADSKTFPGSYYISLIDSDKVSNWQNCNLRKVRKSCSELNDLSEGDSVLMNANSCQPYRETSKVIFTSDHSDVNKLIKKDLQAADHFCDIEKSLPSSFVHRNSILHGEFFKLQNSTIFSTQKFEGSKEVALSTSPTTLNGKAILHEKSLPLKKKAKMKGSENIIEVDRCNVVEAVQIQHEKIKINDFVDEPVAEQLSACIASSSKSPLPTRKIVKKPRKRRCCYSDSELSDETPGRFSPPESCASIYDYSSLNDVVDDLKYREYIDDSFANLILTGLAEMKQNILEEMKQIHSGNGTLKMSYELIAFSLLFYFLRRPAYNYLRCVFERAWPTSQQISEYKKLVNSNIDNKKGGKGKKK